MRRANGELYQAKRDLEDARRERQAAGSFAIFKKRKLEETIVTQTSRIAELEEQKTKDQMAVDEIDQLITRGGELKKRDLVSSKLRNKIQRLESELQDLEGRLTQLNARKE